MADGSLDAAGDVINYTITVLNNGNVALTETAVTDQVESYTADDLAGTSNGDGTLNVGDGRQTPDEFVHQQSASTGLPGDCRSRAIRSASTITAPRSASSADTVDLPAPMPPVSPKKRWSPRWMSCGSSRSSAIASRATRPCDDSG